MPMIPSYPLGIKNKQETHLSPYQVNDKCIETCIYMYEDVCDVLLSICYDYFLNTYMCIYNYKHHNIYMFYHQGEAIRQLQGIFLVRCPTLEAILDQDWFLKQIDSCKARFVVGIDIESLP
jgi:hypothetical protein